MSETILAAWIQALGARCDEDGYSDEGAMHYAINLTRQTMEEWDALADTSPASQGRDVQDAVAREIERWEALAATAKAAKVTVPRRAAEISIQALQGLLARLRSGSEPGERGWSVNHPNGSITELTEDEAHKHALILDANGRGPAFVIRPDGTEDAEHSKPAARPFGGEVKNAHGVGPQADGHGGTVFVGSAGSSCGERAPEPDGLKPCPFCGGAPELKVGTRSGQAESVVFVECRECRAESAWSAHENKVRALWNRRLPPEREAEAREPDGWAETDAPDLNRQGDRWHSSKSRTHIYTVPVYFGTPGPDREAEIRADERGKVVAVVHEVFHATDMSMPTRNALLARLSPTDEQDSPNRSDEP